MNFQHINSQLAKAVAKASTLCNKNDLKICYLNLDAAARLADFAMENRLRKCLIVSDPTTREIAGENVLAALRFRACSTQELIIKHTPLEATLEIAESVVSKATDCDFLIGIGAGTICDLVKYAGSKLSKHVLIFATAPSMNGYTSSIVALRIRGLKRTLPTKPVTGVFADPEILASAPQRMIAAGFADYLSKTSASADWQIAHFLRNEEYCSASLDFYKDIYDELLDETEKIATKNTGAIGKLMQALLLSGLSMLVAGSSAPVSGGEHLISHYLDMKSALNGTSHDLHGAQVGVATLYTLRLWDHILKIDLNTLNPEELAEKQMPLSATEEIIKEDWGPFADAVLEEWGKKYRSPEEIKTEIKFFKSFGKPLLEKISENIEKPEKIASYLKKVGGPISPKELTIRYEDYIKATTNARFLRNRFTVLDLAAELNIHLSPNELNLPR